MLTENNEKITKIATETNFIVQIYFWTVRQKLYNLEALKSVFIFARIRYFLLKIVECIFDTLDKHILHVEC